MKFIWPKGIKQTETIVLPICRWYTHSHKDLDNLFGMNFGTHKNHENSRITLIHFETHEERKINLYESKCTSREMNQREEYIIIKFKLYIRLKVSNKYAV